jgi:hypothetical protein
VKVRYVTAVNNLKISGDLGRGDKLDTTMFITNNRALIRTLVDRMVVPVMGSLEWTTICEADTVIYSTDEIDPTRPPMEFLNHRLF